MKRRTDGSVSSGVRAPAAAGRTHVTAPHRVRLIGGAWKRTPLPVAERPGLRPTPDRVRETLFNWLAHLRPDLAALRGLDLYAGTGALGLELASRGAAGVVLVERDPALAAALRATVQKLGAGAVVEVVAGDAMAVAAGWPACRFDVVFLDPPFDQGLPHAALAEARRLLAPDGLLYLEAAVPLPPEAAAALGLSVLREGRAGRVRFHLLRRDAP